MESEDKVRAKVIHDKMKETKLKECSLKIFDTLRRF